MKLLFKGINRKDADLVLTILASQAIEPQVENVSAGQFSVRVREKDLDNARDHLDLYARENPLPRHLRDESDKKETVPVAHIFFSTAALAAALTLALVHICLIRSALWPSALFAYGISPYFLHQGETFRAVTALFLHSGPEHLMGNMAGIILLAGPLVRISGPGTGLLFLLAASVSGNLIANSLSLDSRLSIGASTAVMAAAGMLSARQAMHRKPRITFWRPLAAGLILTALFSHGPRTDVAAHLFGFLSGTGTGVLVFPLYRIWHRPWMEPVALILVAIILMAAFYGGFHRF